MIKVEQIEHVKQRSEAWYDARKTRFTASQIYRLMGKRGLGQTGETYVMEKVAEHFGAILPDYKTAAMEYGTIMEPFAKRFYERAFDCCIIEEPFYIAPWCDDAGCSPDGLIEGTDKRIEVKCPYNPTEHIKHLMIKSQPELKDVKPEYYWQIMMSMAVLNVDCWDFVSFCEYFEGTLRMMAMEVRADESDIILLKTRISEAVNMRDEIIKKVML